MNDGGQVLRARSGQVVESLARTHAVVVTFEPDLNTFARQLSRLAEEGINAVVVDNNSSEQARIAELAARHRFHTVCLDRNRGVAAAQNAGLDHVRARRGEFVVFLDQDSIPGKGVFHVLLAGLLSVPPGCRVAAVGSSYTLPSGDAGSSFVRFRWFRFEKLHCDPASDTMHEVDFLISSGSLIPVSVLEEVGPLREELFIDHVDTEWFLRARSLGYRSFGCCGAHMGHALGERTIRVWLGRWRTVPVHKSFRYFFTFRNSVWLYRQSHAPAKWVTADLVRLVFILLFSTLLLASRWENLKWMIKGVREGFRDADAWDSTAVLDQVQGVNGPG